MVVNFHLGTGNWTWVLWKSSRRENALNCWAISLFPAFIVFQRDFACSLMLALHFPVELRSTFWLEDSAPVTILRHSGFGGQNGKNYVCPCQCCLLMSYLLLFSTGVTLTAHSGPPHPWHLGPASPLDLSSWYPLVWRHCRWYLLSCFSFMLYKGAYC